MDVCCDIVEAAVERNVGPVGGQGKMKGLESSHLGHIPGCPVMDISELAVLEGGEINAGGSSAVAVYGKTQIISLPESRNAVLTISHDVSHIIGVADKHSPYLRIAVRLRSIIEGDSVVRHLGTLAENRETGRFTIGGSVADRHHAAGLMARLDNRVTFHGKAETAGKLILVTLVVEEEGTFGKKIAGTEIVENAVLILVQRIIEATHCIVLVLIRRILALKAGGSQHEGKNNGESQEYLFHFETDYLMIISSMKSQGALLSEFCSALSLTNLAERSTGAP
jgi:hypothetical protein